MISLIVVILSTQMLFGFNAEGLQVFQAPVAIGQPGHETPVGETYIEHVVVHPFWYSTYGDRKVFPPRDPGNQMGVAKLILKNYGNIRIHGTDTLGIGLNSPRLFSSGCVRVQQYEMMALTELLVGKVDWDAGHHRYTPDRRIRVVIKNYRE